MTKVKRILYTPGEPAGVGPDIVLDLARTDWPVELMAVADPDALRKRALELNLNINIIETTLDNDRSAHRACTLNVLPVAMPHTVTAGSLNPANANYVLNTLNLAAQSCLANKADALVTGPVHKALLNEAGIPFCGHTEFFQTLCQTPTTVMLFVVDEIKVALVTTHLPLSAVPASITTDKIKTTIEVARAGLSRYFNVNEPRILVAGLNPHAGEGGHLGKEEIEIITPALDELRKQYNHVVGPLPADTLFTTHHLNEADVVIAMYHDQALPVIKHIGFDRAVNVTLGLPFIRTSVDHGTALSLAGTGQANSGSLAAAIRLAINMASA